MKKEFTMSIREIVKETVVASITVAVLTIMAWPVLNLYNKRRKEKELVPSPESFGNVKRAEDVHFTEGHPDNQEEAE